MVRLATLLLLPLVVAQDQAAQVTASLNRSTVQVGETVVLTVTVQAPGLRTPEIEDPELVALEPLAKADRSTFHFSTSAGAVREFAREYTLQAKERGRFTIPPIRVRIEGRLYETEALQLEVESRGAVGPLPGGLGPRPEEEVAVRLWVEPETAFVGQQVTMTAAAFFDPSVRSRLQRQPEYRPPEVLGFWTADLPGTVRPERRAVGRREYFVQVYRRALFPLSAGEIVIPPAAVIYEVRRGLIYAPETFQVESPPAKVVVRPLPDEGRPSDFGGAVGRFTAEVWFDRSDLRAGEAVNLILEVQGSGNLSSLARPGLPELPGVRVYEGGEAAEVQLEGVEFAGHKRFSWVLVPEGAGQFVMPELRFAYFDPFVASYRFARTDPIALQVQPAATATALDIAPGSRAIRFVKSNLGRQPRNLSRSRGFWLIQTAPLAVLLGVFALGRYRGRAPTRRRRRPQRRQQALRSLRPLAEVGESTFFGELRLAVLGWLGDRLHVPELAARGVVQVQHALEDAGAPPPVALEVIDLLERCGRLRYSPDPPGAAVATELLTKAEKLLALVDQEAVSERRLRAPHGKVGLLYLLLVALSGLAWTAPLTAQGAASSAEAERWFAEGNTAYGRGDYAAAVGFYERALEERPGDANVLYNLGNSYHALGERGRAVAYWVKALRRSPRDPDARYNLRLVTEDDPVLGSALPPLPLSSDELAILFTVLWFSGCVALIARLRWRRAYLTFIGGAALMIAVGSAALILYPRSEYAIVVADDGVLRAGPVGQSEILAAVLPGVGYRVRERRGAWLRVSRGGDSEGWIESRHIELIH